MQWLSRESVSYSTLYSTHRRRETLCMYVYYTEIERHLTSFNFYFIFSVIHCILECGTYKYQIYKPCNYYYTFSNVY